MGGNYLKRVDQALRMLIHVISESLLLLLLLGSCCVGYGVGSVGIESRGAEPASELPRFEDNLYAQLLMRATAGSLFPADAYSPEDIFYMQARGEPVVPSRKYKHAARENGLDWPSVGHTMIGQCETGSIAWSPHSQRRDLILRDFSFSDK